GTPEAPVAIICTSKHIDQAEYISIPLFYRNKEKILFLNIYRMDMYDLPLNFTIIALRRGQVYK
ncbi:hypothetical protein ACJX0J_015490, partial [Zea mays]